MSKYFEAVGDIKAAILKHLDDLNAAKKKAFALCDKYGAKLGLITSPLGISIVFKFGSTPDPKAWKPFKNSEGYYLPRRSKRGKAGNGIADEVREAEGRFPSGYSACKIIGMEPFGDKSVRSPGLAKAGGKVLISTPDDYEPKGEFAKGIKRISDLQFEKLIAKRKGKSDG